MDYVLSSLHVLLDWFREKNLLEKRTFLKLKNKWEDLQGIILG